eukprot:SAG31_NODE_1127_length_9758_cov_2.771301_10_plen_61_part_00
MKLVGTAMQDYGRNHNLDCIGIVPWGAVAGRRDLDGKQVNARSFQLLYARRVYANRFAFV